MVATGLAVEMSFVAIGWQVYSIHSNPLDLGLIGLAMFIPLPLLALPAGHLADRFPRRTILALATALDTAVMLGLLAVTRAGAEQTWPFYLLAFATGVASALGAPASRAMTPSLVPSSILVRALAIRSIGFQVSVIVGPAIGGLLFAIHSELVYATAAVLSIVSLLMVLLLRAGKEPVGESSPDLQSLLGGVRLVRRTPVLFGAISLDLFAVLFGGAVALLPVFAKDVLDVGPAGLGVLRAAPAVGALCSAIVLRGGPCSAMPGRTLLTVVALYGVTIVVFGLSKTMWLSLLALALGGGLDMVSVVLRQTILPFVTPDELRGRVNAVEMVFISASNELGAFESGVAAALVGAVPAVVLGGVATIAVAVAWRRFFPNLAHVDRLDELRPVPVAVAEGEPRRRLARRRRAHEPRLVGDHDRLGAVAQAELLEDVRDVRLHRVLADDEARGDLGVREAARDEPEHLRSRGVSSSSGRGAAGVRRRENSSIRRRVTEGAKSEPPSATTRIAVRSRSLGGVLEQEPARARAQRVVDDARRGRRSSGRARAGSSARATIASVASMPSTSGMRTSMRTTSGRERAASAIASPPSPASPTTSMSGSRGEDQPEAGADQHLVVGEQDADHRVVPVAGAARGRAKPPSGRRPGVERRRRRRRRARGCRRARGRSRAPLPVAGAVVLDRELDRVAAVVDVDVRARRARRA